MPKEPAPIVGFPSVPCSICGKPTSATAIAKCGPCWELWQRVENHATRLLTDPKSAPQVRALLETALQTKPDPTEPTS